MTHSIPKLLTVADVAEQVGVSASYLNKLRGSGGGPVFIKISTRVLYDAADLAVWLEARKRASTGGAA